MATTPLLIGGLGSAKAGDRQRIMDKVLGAVSPIDDVRSSGEYRTAMVRHVVESLLGSLTETEGGAQG